MFNKIKVCNKYFGLVGFKNPINPDYTIVDVNNEESRSGRYATDNPYCKIEYLKDTQDYKDATYADFNTFLSDLQNKSITDVVDKVLIEPDYIDRQLLYQNVTNKVNTSSLVDDLFVGYIISKSLDKNVAFKIPRIILEFSGTGDIELLLFNSNVSTPIESQNITISLPTQVEELNWVVDNTGDYYGGEWYLGYRTTGLTVTPYKRNYQNSNVKSNITHLCFENIQVPNVTSNTLFDLTTIGGSDECWGLNPDIIVYNDYTDLLLQYENIFAPAIQLQMIINSVQVYLASLRSNRTQRISEEQVNLIIAQLEGVPGAITGLIPTLRKEVHSLDNELKKLINGMFSTGFELLR